MVSFGVPRLDDAFGDGRGDPLLLQNAPGVDPRPFLMQAAGRALAAGQEVVYLSTDRPPHRVADALRPHVRHTDSLTVLDGHSLHGIADPAHAAPMHDVEGMLAQVAQAHASHPRSLFVLESLDGVVVRAGPHQAAHAAKRLQEVLARFEQSVVSHTRWDSGLDDVLECFPGHVRLDAVHERIATHHRFRVLRVAGEAQEGARAAPVLYRSDGGQVRVYVPKVLVTGPAEAGKTTFVHAVSDRAVSTDRHGATVALDRGKLHRRGVEVQIFGTPGQPRFDPMVAPILRQAVGVVLVLDSTRPATFGRGHDMLAQAWRRGLPAVVAANKQDLDGALDVARVRRLMDLPAEVPVVGCQARDPYEAAGVLDGLLRRILDTQEVTA